MERCPHCGASGGNGARFCTTCGLRFESEGGRLMADPSGDASDEWRRDGAISSDQSAGAGWPTPPPAIETTSGVRGGWPSLAGGEQDAETGDGDQAAQSWPGGTSGIWPDAAVSTSTGPSSLLASDGQHSSSWSAGGWQADWGRPSASALTASASAQSIVNRLLDELRTAVASIEVGTQLDLSGVISDLEVAVNPPGALSPDERADLREAILRARERPRDLETAVELSKRVDGIVGLMFAYDRAMAAIERSLTVLRQDQPAETNAGEPVGALASPDAGSDRGQ